MTAEISWTRHVVVFEKCKDPLPGTSCPLMIQTFRAQATA